MAKKKLLPKTAGPIEAVFLGIDSAKGKSGAVLLVPNYDDDGVFEGTYERVMFGLVEGSDQDAREEYVQAGAEEAKDLKVPFIVVAEDWTPGGVRMTFDVIKSLGTGWGRWEAEIFKTKALVVRYKPAEWRELAFTWRYPKGRAAVKLFAQNHIKKLWGFEVSEDVAEAACIAVAGTHSGEVAEVISKTTKKKRSKK